MRDLEERGDEGLKKAVAVVDVEVAVTAAAQRQRLPLWKTERWLCGIVVWLKEFNLPKLRGFYVESWCG
jgi:hypothetical protein